MTEIAGPEEPTTLTEALPSVKSKYLLKSVGVGLFNAVSSCITEKWNVSS